MSCSLFGALCVVVVVCCVVALFDARWAVLVVKCSSSAVCC